MLTLDRPSDASRYDYRRLYVDPPVDDETAALLCWLHTHAPRLAEAQRACLFRESRQGNRQQNRSEKSRDFAHGQCAEQRACQRAR